jgi:hypothetical protein
MDQEAPPQAGLEDKVNSEQERPTDFSGLFPNNPQFLEMMEAARLVGKVKLSELLAGLNGLRSEKGGVIDQIARKYAEQSREEIKKNGAEVMARVGLTPEKLDEHTRNQEETMALYLRHQVVGLIDALKGIKSE